MVLVSGAVGAERLFASMLSLVLQVGTGLLLGLTMLAYQDRVAVLEERERRLRAEKELRERRIMLAMAHEIHDHVSTRLAQVVLEGDALLRDLPAGAVSCRVERLRDTAQDAAAQLRSLMLSLRQGRMGDGAPLSLGAVLDDTCCTLRSAGLVPVVDVPEEAVVLDWLGHERCQVLDVVLREAALNAARYSRPGTEVRISIEEIDGRVELLVVSTPARRVAGNAPSLKGAGLGILGLTGRVEAVGGQLSAGLVGELWMLAAVFSCRGQKALPAIQVQTRTEQEEDG